MGLGVIKDYYHLCQYPYPSFFPNLVVSFVDVYPSAFSFASQNKTEHPLTK